MTSSCSTRIAGGEKRRGFGLRLLALFAATSLLQGCIIQSIQVQGEHDNTECRDPNGQIRACEASDRYVLPGESIGVALQGMGECGQGVIDFGDGTTPFTLSHYTLDPAATAAITNHIYTTSGTKTIRARGVTDCTGDVTRRVWVRSPPGRIQSIQITNESTPAECRDDYGVLRTCDESDRFVTVDRAFSVVPEGTDECGQMTTDFGDGTPPVTTSYITLNPSSTDSTHTYRGWPGARTIRVRGGWWCSGDATKTVRVRMHPNTIGFQLGLGQPTPTQCNAVPNMPPIRAGSTVRIETDGQRIDYGPKPGGGRYTFNASGDSTAVVPQGYLFPHRKKFSIVYKIGSADFQGEAGPVHFLVPQTGPLEICTNDNPAYLSDNSGGMMLTITVVEPAP